MTDDHTFIDSDGNLIRGREEVLQVWRVYEDTPANRRMLGI